jgi:opacity protein-like surface antigen
LGWLNEVEMSATTVNRSQSTVSTRALACGILLGVAGVFSATQARADDALDDDDAKGEPQKPSLKALQTETVAAAPREGKPPPGPKPEQQEPRPYVPPYEPVGKERHVTLMAVGGLWQHGFNGNTATSKVGPVWGVSGLIEPYRWLGVRATVLRGNQPVTPDTNTFTDAGLQVTQPHFELIFWSIRIEPTWHVTRDFSLWTGVGVGWARAVVRQPNVADAGWVSANRACVYLEGHWALGAQYELIRDWVVLDLDLSASDLGYQKGSAHDPLQAFTAEGHRTHLGSYPYFSHKVQGLFGIGVIL